MAFFTSASLYSLPSLSQRKKILQKTKSVAISSKNESGRAKLSPQGTRKKKSSAINSKNVSGRAKLPFLHQKKEEESNSAQFCTILHNSAQIYAISL
jgi:hypothetical protein